MQDYPKALATDADELADIRVAAMQPSLEAAGLFNPARARRRFLGNFSPPETYKIFSGTRLVGFFVLRAKPDHCFLDHLYVHPDHQRRGHGKNVLNHVLRLARTQGVPVRLMALNDSPALGFYKRAGFRTINADKLDTHLEYAPAKTRHRQA